MGVVLVSQVVKKCLFVLNHERKETNCGWLMSEDLITRKKQDDLPRRWNTKTTKYFTLGPQLPVPNGARIGSEEGRTLSVVLVQMCFCHRHVCFHIIQSDSSSLWLRCGFSPQASHAMSLMFHPFSCASSTPFHLRTSCGLVIFQNKRRTETHHGTLTRFG